MKPWMLLILCAPLIAGCTKTETVPNTNQPTENAPTKESSAQQEKVQNGENTGNPIEAEPAVTGRLSTDLKDAEGKKLTRCEYRYLHKNGEFVSVVAEMKGLPSIKVTARESATSDIKTYKMSRTASLNNKKLEEYLHKLDTYGTIPGPLMWLDAPERENWAKDDSTTWIIMNYGDIQFIVSSRQQLPESRYKAFYTIYTYMTSFVPEFNRKMRQNIGEPATPIVKTVHGKEVELVPGTGNTVLDGAEINYGEKKWWIEEEFVGKFESTEKTLKLSADKSEDKEAHKASMNIDKDGNYSLKLDDKEYLGSLSDERLYHIDANAWMIEKTEASVDALKNSGRIDYGQHLFLDYNDGGDDIKEYSRIRLMIEGEPYVEGIGYTPSKTIFLDRK